ncbi:MAG: hypothetical protein A2600_04070 [Candidatus Lambdaproteobacteria bacterium RIFOXYD1_FULL_56_27]|uniref:Uncharacterized protein n=1 Tax=Candidatus Lambdaproteobacteria bacterium RIFOXYD2_FULL_56_26 TaxID=1817773 RepID=A0A1F6H3I7_9PROT|nr:MAG: hypothetical protein A2426_01870 [Candidatus Lambdaproteobacteria bacterium RIFOXYC1_FULL_56_13]OGH04933.1 MAG: hypothetical protein A2557_08135 [Candidatus Lambdaproteobacteria bacterium RIFOXYD2_FULL_56_26]OGH09398.1 MAG: hypothetical protein A2600_04070 [Candidatus Lambdaproteobacteria bacterium RIFOXYD1_FULL_56_27]
MKSLGLLLVLCTLAPAFLHAGLPTEPGLDALTLKKMRWLERFGTPIRAGSPDHKVQTFGCNHGDQVLLRHQWGLEQTWLQEHLVECPAFFFDLQPPED